MALRHTTAVFGVAAIAAGIVMQVTRDGPLRVPAAVAGVVLVLGGIACTRRLVTGGAALATIMATVWLLSGVAQLAIAATVGGSAGDRLLALGGVSTLVGAAFAVSPPTIGERDPST